MKLIKPSQISGEIMTLIEEADGRLIIVSPYCKFSDWKKFLNTIEYLKRKNTPVEFYVRVGEAKTIKEVEKIGFVPIPVANLHTKLYVNEKYAIVSSMNLLTYSDMNSLDIAYKTETKEEYDELLEYYKRYLEINKPKEESKIKTADVLEAVNPYLNEIHQKKIYKGGWIEYLIGMLNDEMNCRSKLYFDNTKLVIQCNNKYEAHISQEGKSKYLNIMGILSQKETDILHAKLDKFKDNSGLDVSISKNGYNTIWHHSKICLESSDLNYLYKDDYNVIVQVIFDFVVTLQSFKEHCREIH